MDGRIPTEKQFPADRGARLERPAKKERVRKMGRFQKEQHVKRKIKCLKKGRRNKRRKFKSTGRNRGLPWALGIGEFTKKKTESLRFSGRRGGPGGRGM